MGIRVFVATAMMLATVGLGSVSAKADALRWRPRPPSTPPVVSDPSTPAAASTAVPTCQDSNSSRTLPVDNQQVITWKTTTDNEFEARGHIQGTLTKVYPDASGHHHFEIEIGTGAQGMIEVIYNEGFDALPTLSPGMTVEACGDYITAYASSGGYKASPDGALIHWVHRSDSAKHPSGFLVINGQVYR